jgi:hypothetical protein
MPECLFLLLLLPLSFLSFPKVPAPHTSASRKQAIHKDENGVEL